MSGQANENGIPQHIAIILDGNGRWAERRGVPRAMGHKEGCETLERILKYAARIGVKYLTVYGFSTENWKRSAEEVGALMSLFRYYIRRLRNSANEEGCRCVMLGDRSRFDEDLVKEIGITERETAGNTRLCFQFALNYGGRDELRRAFIRLLKEYEEKPFDADSVTEDMISARLDTAGAPDPDLLIRTGGDLRVSNFLLWQIAYTELYVTDTLWPDFSEEELDRAVASFGRRERRFGGRKA